MGLLQALGLAGAPRSVRQLFGRLSRSKSKSKPSSPSRSPPPSPSPQPHSQPSQTVSVNAEPATLPPTSTLLAKAPSQASVSSAQPQLPSTGSAAETAAMLRASSTTATLSKETPTASSLTAAPTKSLVQDPNVDKENQTPIESKDALADDLGSLSLSEVKAPPQLLQSTRPSIYDSDDPVIQAEKARHQKFTDEALAMARLALRTNETPVGCVLVRGDQIIAKGMNATNITRNGTRHAEFMAITALLSYPSENGARTTHLGPPSTKTKMTKSSGEAQETSPTSSISDSEQTDDDESDTPAELTAGNEDGALGHLFPYGQKLHPDPIVDPSIVKDCVLYVTVEPCVMCASLLRQLQIKKVYFGAVNDKFGGTGGVFNIHANADPEACASKPKGSTRAPPPLIGAAGTLGESFPNGGGDGGNVEPGYEIEGGWGRDEAVGLLRRFYVQENGRAPVPRKKEGRAARLAAMMEQGGPDAVCAAMLGEEDMIPGIDKPITPIAASGNPSSTDGPIATSKPAVDDAPHTLKAAVAQDDSDKENVETAI